jgi:hypothetical protein
MSQLYGHWPIKVFKELPKELQTQFWRSHEKGQDALEILLTRTVLSNSVERKTQRKQSDMLPLSVWATKGFDIERLKTNVKAEDWEDDPVLGWCCRVALSSSIEDNVEETIRGQLADLKAAAAERKAAKKGSKRSRSSSSNKSDSSSSSKSSAKSGTRKGDGKGKKEKAAAKKEKDAAKKEKAEARVRTLAEKKEKADKARLQKFDETVARKKQAALAKLEKQRVAQDE